MANNKPTPGSTTTTTPPAAQAQPSAYAVLCAACTSAYAPKPLATVALGLGPAALAAPGNNPKQAGSATHARWAALVAGMATAKANGTPYTVAMALATGLTLGDVRWALSPAHQGGAQLVAL